jgi:hypothetical protein
MTHPETQASSEGQKIIASLQKLEARVSRLERHLALPPISETPSPPEPANASAAYSSPKLPGGEENSGLELRVGELGLAWVGSIIFLLGIVFLMAYTYSLGYHILATILGYLTALGLYALARLWRESFLHLSRLMTGGSFLLLFYTTMRLHFFSAEPLVGNAYLALLLLLLGVALELSLAVRRRSQSLASLAMLLGVTSALLIDTTHLSLPLVVAHAALAVYLTISRGWRHLLVAAIILAYAAHLVWLLNNPVAGHPVQGVAEHQYNLAYLFLYAAAFSWPALWGEKALAEDARSMSAIVLNCLGFSLLTLLAVLTHFQQSYAAVSLGVAGFFLLISVIQWLRTHQQFAPAIYACFGHLALSIAIYGLAAVPTSFLWLSWQSLLVVSMALWFRSKILVVVNSLIYLGILLTYLATAPSSDPVNFSFALVALASARVMNWQKERLTLRTELLRNVYLSAAFVMTLYALYRAVPREYVTLSWTAAAVGYFLLSYMLRNIKYRGMATSTVLVTVLYLLLVDLARLDARFRVAAFLFLGLLALVISLFYTKIRRLLASVRRSLARSNGHRLSRDTRGKFPALWCESSPPEAPGHRIISFSFQLHACGKL